MSKQLSDAERVGASVPSRNGSKPGAATETSVDDAVPAATPSFGGLAIDFSGDIEVGAPVAPAPLPSLAIDFGGTAVVTAPGGPGFTATGEGRTESKLII